MNIQQRIDTIIAILKQETEKYTPPVVTQFSYDKNPFKVLISCLLSLRTKDTATGPASERLFALADSPEKMLTLSTAEIEKVIYPVGFYKTKAQRIKDICTVLIAHYHSTVPNTIDALLTLKGIGRKTANLVVTLGYGKLGICVDTHVHRLSNRLGLVKTKNPHETEFALRKLLSKKHWIIYNDLLVTWGQNVCAPISPFCSRCAVYEYCERIGVEKRR